MNPEVVIWLIFGLPLASFIIISLVIRGFLPNQPLLASTCSITTSIISFILSLYILFQYSSIDPNISSHSIIHMSGFTLSFGILLNPLTIVMLLIVTIVSILVQIYSIGYMHNDPSFIRYFAYLSLFTACMIGIVISSNLIQLFVFWELVGLCSYLLIGFWHYKPSASYAAKKAFIVTRIGDIGFLIVLLLIISIQTNLQDSNNILNISTLVISISNGLFSSSQITIISLGLLSAAIGKSAQFPLHVWLPDAMEGPTPVSALIHAATMVAAGVFLLARFFPSIYSTIPDIMLLIACIGSFTALFSALMALVQTDIKRILAYSTISQLGYMFAAIGFGAWGAAIFHLVTHAFFKSLLFLLSGNISHGIPTHSFDLRNMGQLRRKMPFTFIAILCGACSLAGIFPFSGFWSKDEILAGALTNQQFFIFGILLLTTFITSIYIFRIIHLVFLNPKKQMTGQQVPDNAHEANWVMNIPILLLSIAAVGIGVILNSPIDLGLIKAHMLSSFINSPIHPVNLQLMIISTTIGISGFFITFWYYNYPIPIPSVLKNYFLKINHVLINKYYIDTIYEKYFMRKFIYSFLANFLYKFDEKLIDNTVNQIGATIKNSSHIIKQIQNGQMQVYAGFTSLGVLIFFVMFIIFIR